MRKILALSVVLLLTSGAAYSVDYVWNQSDPNTNNNLDWDDNANWTPTPGPNGPDSFSDTALINTSGCVDMGGSSTTINIGEVIFDNGSNFYPRGSGLITWYIRDDGGESGDWLYLSTKGWDGYNSVEQWHVDGHWIIENKQHYFRSSDEVHMYGANKGIKVYAHDGGDIARIVLHAGAGVYDNGTATDGFSDPSTIVTVQSGAQIIKRPDAVNSQWVARAFVFEGGQSNLPAYKENVDFIIRPHKVDNETTLGVDDFGFNTAVVYPQGLYVGGGYWGTPTPLGSIFYKPAGGDIRTGGDFEFRTNRSYAVVADGHWLHLIDNGTGVQRHIDVAGNMRVGNAPNYGKYGIKMYNATVNIDGRLRFGGGNPNSGTLIMDSATIYLGGDLDWYSSYVPDQWAIDNWDPGTSTLICDGNGLAVTQNIESYGYLGIKFNNFIVNNPGGQVRLVSGAAGDLVLTGDLKILAGTFNQNNRLVTFNGPGHDWQDGVGMEFDNILLAQNAEVTMLSDITIQFGDNLLMASGSALYLNGFTLHAEGQDLVSSEIGQMAWDDGTIIGTIPEPGTMLLIGTGILGLLGYIRRRRMK
ncbi:MAG: hypothetical protein AMK75_04860 [Planctomycetes bacterium SM23_65]|nr:MAG: hypothetical protein AMK75_04860 [Planctomycetes bacterium SM23_65]